MTSVWSVVNILLNVNILMITLSSTLTIDPVPEMTDATKQTLQEIGAVKFFYLWKYGIEQQKKSDPQSVLAPAPKTIVCPHNMAILSLVPMDAPNPLYGPDVDGSTLRARVLRDYMVDLPVDPEEDKLKIEGGFQATNYNNKTIAFIKDQNGELKIQQFPVMEVHKSSDGAFIYVFMGTLFDQRDLVQEAMRALYVRSSGF